MLTKKIIVASVIALSACVAIQAKATTSPLNNTAYSVVIHNNTPTSDPNNLSFTSTQVPSLVTCDLNSSPNSISVGRSCSFTYGNINVSPTYFSAKVTDVNNANNYCTFTLEYTYYGRFAQMAVQVVGQPKHNGNFYCSLQPQNGGPGIGVSMN